MTRLSLMAVMVLLSACANYQQINPGNQRVGGLTVTTSAPLWNSVPSAHAPGGLPTWTIDGVPLNSLSFVSGVSDGKALVNAGKAETYPVFHADMLANDIAELVESTCAKMFKATVSGPGDVRPMTIGGQPGFAIEFEFVSDDEVIRRAFAGGTTKDGRLQLILFQAPRMHYYGKDIAAARELIVSAKLP